MVKGTFFKRRAGHIFERRHPSLTGLLRRRSRLLCSPERVRKRVVGLKDLWHLFYRRKFANSRAAQEVILIRYDLKACCTSTQRCGPHLRASYVENAGVEGRIGLCTHSVEKRSRVASSRAKSGCPGEKTANMMVQRLSTMTHAR